MCNTPILYIIFNRLDTVKQTFPLIRNQQPKYLFIAADGPRLDRSDEIKKCKEVREWVLSQIDWNCELKTLFREENLGCGQGPATAITWFFKNVEEGIVLEDDCLASNSFFKYCEKLLTFYKNDKRIMHIAGFNIMGENPSCYPYSYSFAAVQACWGWASWKDRWEKYSYHINIDKKKLFSNKYFNSLSRKLYWVRMLNNAKNLNAWDFQWTYTVLANHGYCAFPSHNLISNIGFGSDSTHFTKGDENLKRKNHEIVNIKFRPNVNYDKKLINYTDKVVFEIDKSNIKFITKKLLVNPLKWFLKKIKVFNYLKKIYTKE